MIRKRWLLSTDGGLNYTQEVTPVNSQSIKFSFTRNLKAGEIFFRTKLTSPLRFKDPDFAFFYSWERTSVRRCNDLYIRQQRICDDGEAITFWTGKFSTGAGSFNLDACECSFKPEVYDRYSCILDHLDDKVNILSVPPVDTDAILIASNVEFGACATVGFVPTPFGACDEFWNPPPTEINGWDAVHAQVITGGQLNIFMRERVVTDCVAGSPVPPPGAGWALLIDNCAIDGTATYVRQSPTAYTFGDATMGTMSGTTPVPPDDSCPWIFIGIAGVEDPFDPLNDSYGPWFICPYNGTPTDYNRNRLLLSCVEHMLEKTGCEIEDVVSDFFEWNPDGTAPGYVAGDNYITGETNQVDHLGIMQKSDAIDPAASNPATIGELSFKELFAWFRSEFRVFWDITADGKFRLEHWHYYTFTQGLDLTVGEDFELNRMFNRYEHLSQEIPSHERFSMAEAQGRDFVGVDIIYDSPCVIQEGREAVEETKLANLTTDLAFINADPDAISKSGFVMLATQFDGAIYHVIIDTGALSGTLATNAPLSWANLEDNFFRWDRYLKRGNMNTVDVVFNGIVPNIQQPDLKARFCCGMETWNPQDTVKTELGERFLNFRQAFVEKAELEDNLDRLSLTPRYAY